MGDPYSGEITRAISLHARRTPSEIALIFEDDRITWHDLDTHLERLATYICRETPEASSIALHLPTGPALALFFLAIIRAGREAQVFDPEWPMATVHEVRRELAPALTITRDSSMDGARVLILPDQPTRFTDLTDVVGAPAAFDRIPEVSTAKPFYVGFTSGSTGLPKGYRRTQDSWLASFRTDVAEFGLSPADAILVPGTLAHSLFLYAFLRGLHAGARVILSGQFRPNGLLRVIDKERVSIIYGVPTQFLLLIDAAEDLPARSFPSVRWILSTGAKWPADKRSSLRRAFPSAAFCEFYGASELSYVTLAKDRDDVPATSVGRPFPDVQVSIRDRRGRRLPSGKTGLVCAESKLCFMEYAFGTNTSLTRFGKALSVGDLGFLDQNGFLHLVGRSNRMIISSGRNIYPEEIEKVLERHPDIASVAVLGPADALRGERLIALIQPKSGSGPRSADLIAYARKELPMFKVPRIYARVADWPVTPSGKTNFDALDRLWRERKYEVLK